MRDIVYGLVHGLGELVGLLVAAKLFWWIVLPAFVIGAGITALMGYGVFGLLLSAP
jgi:hypothetical protein